MEQNIYAYQTSQRQVKLAILMAADTARKEPLTLGERVQRLRLARNWSIPILAQRTGMHPESLNALERIKNRSVQSRHLKALCLALDVSADELLGLKDGASFPQ